MEENPNESNNNEFEKVSEEDSLEEKIEEVDENDEIEIIESDITEEIEENIEEVEKEEILEELDKGSENTIIEEFIDEQDVENNTELVEDTSEGTILEEQTLELDLRTFHQNLIEAALYAAGGPLTIEELSTKLEFPKKDSKLPGTSTTQDSDKNFHEDPNYGYKLFTDPIGVRVIAYIDPSDGYPILVPHLQLQAIDHNRLYFPFTSLKEDLQKIPTNAKVAVFASNFDMANQVVKGMFTGFKKTGDVEYGLIDIEEVYNSSPPITGKIYPKIESRPKVTKFSL